MQKSLFRIVSLCFALGLLSSGCVSMQEFHDLEKQRDTVADQNRNLKMKVEALTNRNEDLTAQIAALEKIRDETLQLEDEQKASMEQLIRQLRGEIDQKSVKVSLMEEQLRVQMLDRLVFDSGSAEISANGREVIGRIAPVLNSAADKEIRVIGHTDDIPVGSSLKEKYPSNWELSAARAAAVVRLLQWGHGVDPQRIVVQGVSHYRALEISDADDARKENRAVEIILAPMDIQ